MSDPLHTVLHAHIFIFMIMKRKLKIKGRYNKLIDKSDGNLTKSCFQRKLE